MGLKPMLPTPERRMGQSSSYHYRPRSALIGQVPNKLHVDPCDLDVAGASLRRDIKSARVIAATEHRANTRITRPPAIRDDNEQPKHGESQPRLDQGGRKRVGLIR